MSRLAVYISVAVSLLFSACTKTDLPPQNLDPNEWMQTHQRAEVTYDDYFSGNYIVQTPQGFAVVENWGGAGIRDFDVLYAHFQFTGMQTIYNRTRNYFTTGRVVANWLTWGEAWNILDQISRQ